MSETSWSSTKLPCMNFSERFFDHGGMAEPAFRLALKEAKKIEKTEEVKVEINFILPILQKSVKSFVQIFRFSRMRSLRFGITALLTAQ